MFGIILLLRYISYKIDSSLYAGQVLFLSGALGIINYYLELNILVLIGGYVAVLSLASLSVFIKFRQFFHMKAFVLLALYAILLTTFATGLVRFWVFISLLIVVVIQSFILIISGIRRNTRKV
jgi:hypothetical protein